MNEYDDNPYTQPKKMNYEDIMATQPAAPNTTGSNLAAGGGAGGSVGGGLGGALGAYFGGKAAKKDVEAADLAYQQALEKIQGLSVPELQELKYIGERELPKIEDKDAYKSEQGEVTSDPELVQKQMAFLEALKEQGRVGLTAEDLAAFRELRSKNLRDQQAQTQSILSRAQERGATPGSGVELAMQQAAQQQGAEGQAAASDRLSSMAAQRAAQAKGKYGELLGNLRSTGFEEKSRSAAARDVATAAAWQNSAQNIRLNAQNEIAKNIRDAEAGRSLQEYNLAKLPMNQYNMTANKAQLESGALGQSGAQKMAKAQNTMQGYTTMGQGIGTAVGGAAGMGIAAASDEKLKKNVKEANKEIESFMDNLKALKYSYKEPEVDGEGEHFSPMAQDLEKSKPGKAMVEETPRGKYVDYAKGFGTMTAALANLNKRLRDLEKK